MNHGPDHWTPERIAAALRASGIPFVESELRSERREGRTKVTLPLGRLAWFPSSQEAAEVLLREDRVLRLVRERCSFAVPEPLFASTEGWSVRTLVPGTVDPYGYAARLKADPLVRRRAAVFLGQTLAELHAIRHADDVGWLPTEPLWPLPRETIREALPRVCSDAELRRRINRILTAYDGAHVPSAERALVHSDLGLHNLAVDDASGTINGIFDFAGAVWTDPHLDFRYFVFSAVPDALLDGVLATYQGETGAVLCRSRILLCNAVGAVSYLANRADRSPDEVVDGRTLKQDIGWTRWALQRAGF